MLTTARPIAQEPDTDPMRIQLPHLPTWPHWPHWPHWLHWLHWPRFSALPAPARSVMQYGLWCLAAFIVLQLYFIARIAAMAVINPGATAFERTQIWRLTSEGMPLEHWQEQWRDYSQISTQLKRAVICSEDDSFATNDGVDWGAIRKAWQKNAQVKQQLALRQQQHLPAKNILIRGGSTITQQLAKNLFLSSERSLLRKSQELILTMAIDKLLSKQRILEIYLNKIEWGDGIFGAQAAARHYFQTDAHLLMSDQAARLAVMLPRPRYYDSHLYSHSLSERSAVIQARMRQVQLPL